MQTYGNTHDMCFTLNLHFTNVKTFRNVSLNTTKLPQGIADCFVEVFALLVKLNSVFHRNVHGLYCTKVSILPLYMQTH